MLFRSDTYHLPDRPHQLAVATTGESSCGLHATYAGVITGSDLAIETQGAHCAAVATDRGSGTVTVDGTNTFTTNSDGSPCLYSTGQITVSGLTGQVNASQAVVVEGKNHATVSDSTLTSASTKGGVMLYQSMSGDADDADAATEVSTLVMTRVDLRQRHRLLRRGDDPARSASVLCGVGLGRLIRGRGPPSVFEPEAGLPQVLRNCDPDGGAMLSWASS